MSDQEKKTKLRPKQERWVEAFVETGNKSEAARRAGYRHPSVTGSIVSRLPHVQERVQEELRKLDQLPSRIAKLILGQVELAEQGKLKPKEVREVIKMALEADKKPELKRNESLIAKGSPEEFRRLLPEGFGGSNEEAESVEQSTEGKDDDLASSEPSE